MGDWKYAAVLQRGLGFIRLRSQALILQIFKPEQFHVPELPAELHAITA